MHSLSDNAEQRSLLIAEIHNLIKHHEKRVSALNKILDDLIEPPDEPPEKRVSALNKILDGLIELEPPDEPPMKRPTLLLSNMARGTRLRVADLEKP